MIHTLKQVMSRLRLRIPKRGQSMAEFAVALPVLLFIILGFIEAARWFQAYLAVQYAAREAARYAVSGQPPRLSIDGPNSCQDVGHPETSIPYPQIDDDTLEGTPPTPAWVDEYRQCREDWIIHVARHIVITGLLVDPSLNDWADVTKPYFLGISVRGSPEFGEIPVEHNPGVARTPVEITIIYNHPVANPFFAAMLPTIRLIGRAQMVNEPWEGGLAEKPPEMPTATPLPPLDSDGDGWNDIEERDLYGTLPSNPDTDGDGYDEGPPPKLDNTGEKALNPCDPDPCSP